MDASPWPVRIPSEIQVVLDAAVHVQSRVAETPTDPLPPVAGNGAVGGLGIVIWHLLADGAATEVEVEALLQCENTHAPNRIELRRTARPKRISRALCKRDAQVTVQDLGTKKGGGLATTAPIQLPDYPVHYRPISSASTTTFVV
jgi:hypothetical protein